MQLCIIANKNQFIDNGPGHFLRIRQWGGGGGIYKKGPYYTEYGEMIDGLLLTKSLVWYRI